jgi:hypothetical protein
MKLKLQEQADKDASRFKSQDKQTLSETISSKKDNLTNDQLAAISLLKDKNMKLQKDIASIASKVIEQKLSEKREKPNQILTRLKSYVSFKTNEENLEETRAIRGDDFKNISQLPLHSNAVLIKVFQLDYIN